MTKIKFAIEIGLIYKQLENIYMFTSNNIKTFEYTKALSRITVSEPEHLKDSNDYFSCFLNVSLI